MKIILLALIGSIGSLVQTQQQSNETCNALEQLINGRNVVVLGDCARNTQCTQISCTNRINPNPETDANQVLTFLCKNVTSLVTVVRYEVTTIQTGEERTNIANVTVCQNETVHLGSLGMVDLGLTHMNNGVTFEASSSAGSVFQRTNIPFECEIETTMSTQKGTTIRPRALMGTILMIAAAAFFL